METLIQHHLSTVKDTDFHLTATELGLTASFTETNDKLDVFLRSGVPTLGLQKSLLPTLQTKLQHALPTHQVTFHLEQAIQAHATQLLGKGLRGVKNVLAIASGKGGVGKSTVAVNTAVALAKLGARVGLLDADIYGPSIPMMLGPVAPVQMQGEQYAPVYAHGIVAMSIGYLSQEDTALIWRGPMLAKALLQLLDLTAWDALDYLIVDLPPGTGDIQLSLVQKIPLAGAIVVTTPQAIATLDAQKALDLFHKTHIHVLGVIENMSYHHCAHCGHQDNLFGTGGGMTLTAQATCDLLGQLPLESGIRADSDQGRPSALSSNEQHATPFLKAAFKTAWALSLRPLNYADRFPNIVTRA